MRLGDPDRVRSGARIGARSRAVTRPSPGPVSAGPLPADARVSDDARLGLSLRVVVHRAGPGRSGPGEARHRPGLRVVVQLEPEGTARARPPTLGGGDRAGPGRPEAFPARASAPSHRRRTTSESGNGRSRTGSGRCSGRCNGRCSDRSRDRRGSTGAGTRTWAGLRRRRDHGPELGPAREGRNLTQCRPSSDSDAGPFAGPGRGARARASRPGGPGGGERAGRARCPGPASGRL